MELEGDPDREFILYGVQHGFDIIDPESLVSPVEVENHKSVGKHSELYAAVHSQILKEIDLGNYIITDHKPLIVSPLGAIPKDDGSIRLIHDCSLPKEGSVNDYASVYDKQKFQTIDDAVALCYKGYYMAKLDLKAAYRSVGISIESQKVTGISWCFDGKPTYLYDNKLCFGSRWAPSIFNRLSQAIKRAMNRRGYMGIVAYLDDFWLVSDSFAGCKRMLLELIYLVRRLGFYVNYNKVVGPTQKIVFLGVEINTTEMTVALPEEKLAKCKQMIQQFRHRKRASKKQLQKIAGLLGWAAGVVRHGRVYLRRLITAYNSIKTSNGRAIISPGARLDLDWWDKCLDVFNGKSMWLDRSPVTSVFVDACNSGAGGTYGCDWFYCDWHIDWPECSDIHINYKEVLAVVLAAWRWAPFWSGKCIYIMSDNVMAVSAINKARCKNDFALQGIRVLHWLAAIFNFHVKAFHIPGYKNVFADAASRLRNVGVKQWFLRDSLCLDGNLFNHMSCKTMVSLCREYTGYPAGVG